MPSSNHPTDTNNNSNSKITNGNSDVLLVVPTRIMSGATSVATSGANLASATNALLMPNHQQVTATTTTTPTAASIATPPTAAAVVAGAITAQESSNNDLITSIKQHEQHNNAISINNNNNIHNINHNNNNNGVIPPIRNQRQNNKMNNNNSNSSTCSNKINNITRQQQQQQQQQKQQQADSRSVEELTRLIRDFNFDRTLLTNEELIKLVKNNQISIYKLENFLGKDNASRCVEIRRDFYRLELNELDKHDQSGIQDRAKALLNDAKFNNLDYDRVNGACCENVIGHVKVPVGLAGPLLLDGEAIFVPLATTEGCLVASTCRGLSALRKSGGVTSRIRRDFMTRAPIVRFNNVKLNDALDQVELAIRWLNDRTNKEKMRAAFNLTSSHGRFIDYTMYPVNREIHIRFEAQTGDAMGMNMCSKGVESALKEMQRAFPTMEIVTLSGNMCTDKKAAGINWINGRGKAVECNAELPAQVVKQVFKVSVDQLVDRWKSKVMIGSALAASIGGFNSQAANILTAIFIATGQDPAQNVTSSNCMLILEKDSKGSLVVCCTMPSIECGTVGGGTILGDQSRYLQMMGVRGPTPKQKLKYSTFIGNDPSSGGSRIISSSTSLHLAGNSNGAGSNTMAPSQQHEGGKISNSSTSSSPSSQTSTSCMSNLIDTNEYTNARKLARIICATVMAGELSLLAALTEGTLVKSHMRHNRSSNNVLGGAGGGPNGLDENGSERGGGGAGDGGGGIASCGYQSCFGPLGSINNTTVINHNNTSGTNHHSKHKSSNNHDNNNSCNSNNISYNVNNHTKTPSSSSLPPPPYASINSAPTVLLGANHSTLDGEEDIDVDVDDDQSADIGGGC